MRTTPHLTAAFLTATLAACGGSSMPEAIAAGSGSGTLVVQASVESSSSVPNSATASQYATEATVRVWRVVNGTRIGAADAAPQLSLDGAVVTLAADATEPGRFTFAGPGVPLGDVALDVTAGNDVLRGVLRRSPGLHTFTNPTGPGANVSASAPFPAAWTRPGQADSATLEMSQFQSLVGDTGAYTVAAGAMGAVSAGQAKPGETCRLARRNEVNVAGGVPGFDSWLHVTVRQDLGGITLVP